MAHLMPELTVLESVAKPGPTVKYIDQVVRRAPENIHFLYFSWRRALLSRYDVFHVHWPEFLIRSDSWFKKRIKRAGFALLVRRLRRRRIAVVRTVHNLAPHAKGDAEEARLLSGLDELVDTYVLLNSCTPAPSRGRSVIVPHGDYVEQFASIPRSQVRTGRLLYFGRIEPYKGVVELMDAFAHADIPESELRIVGSAAPAMAQEIEARTRRSPSTSALLGYVSDEQMVAEITAAELVVLPYREMHNSGVLLVALSLGKPVLVPAGCVNDEISREVGPGWVTQYEGEISAAVLQGALVAVRETRSAFPALDRRSWESVAQGYARAFEQAGAHWNGGGVIHVDGTTRLQ